MDVPDNILNRLTYFHTPDSKACKKALKEIEDSQQQFFDNLISAAELEAQIKRAEEKYFKQKYWNKACDNLKAKLLARIKK